MADFEKAYYKTMKHEGGYIHDPDDAGGETYMGISRKYNPGWDGWGIIDDLKGSSNFSKCLDDSDELLETVENFYKQRYWDVNMLDDFEDQAVAEEMFDTGVNMGVRRAAKFLQESLNYLNRNGSLFSDLVVDGVIGSATMNALSKLQKDDYSILLTMLNVCQGRHYMEYMKKSPIQEKYARGWFSRVKLSKE